MEAECTPECEGQIRREIDVGNRVCAGLGMVITALEGRLSTVLRHDLPPVGGDPCEEVQYKTKKADQLVPLAHEIRTIHENITVQMDRLNAFIKGLEL